jgi:DNA topoisomerase I
MAKKMIIVESKAKTQSIGKIVGDDYMVRYCLGHIYDLPDKELGIDVKNDFKPQFKVVAGKSRLIKDLQKESVGLEEIILATDPDREGESIAWHLSKLFPNQKTSRMTFNEITPKAVREALGNLRAIDMNLVDAQQARRVLDRLVGYKLSPLLWKILNNSRLSAGRVQSVALRLICEREREVEGFKPEEYWSIDGIFGRLEGARESLTASFVGTLDEDIKIGGEQQAKELIAALEKCAYRVLSVKKKTEKRRALPPFITSSLQQEASRRLNFSASKTMVIAQQLYEGIEIGPEGVVGLITYMRTDSVRVASDAAVESASYIKEKFGINYLPEKLPIYKSRAGSQDAHEAIRPTLVAHEPKSLTQYLSKDQHKLYKLIWARFVASQMAPANVDVTRFDIAGDEKYLFRVTGSVIQFDGYLKVYSFKSPVNGKEEKNGEEEIALPELAEKEKLDLQKLDPKQHFTKPPSRYSEASLVRELEERGIGRPSTYVPIIETLKKRDYTRIEKRSFRPTKWGTIVNDLLTKNFGDIVDYNFTARMEEELDGVEAGNKKWDMLVKDFYGPFSADLEKASREMKFEEKVDEKCPDCGGDLQVKPGKFGLFLGCSNYPTCKFTKPYDKSDDNGGAARVKATPTGRKCEKCGSEMVVRTGKYGKFLACSGYPKCKNIKSYVPDVDCPREGCGGKIVARRTKKKRTFYGCSKYPDCDFVTWSMPVEGRKCPDCGGMLVFSKQKNDNAIKCINEKCGKIIQTDEETPEAAEQKE